MRDWLLRTAVRRSLADIRHVVPVRPEAAPSPVARIYGQVEREFGVLAPPVVLHSPEPAALAACWAMLRETLVAGGRVDRAGKEAVAAAVSVANGCPYCVEVHGAALHGLAGGADATAIAADRIASVADPQVRRLAEWARRTGTRDDARRADRPFGRDDAPEVIGVAVTFHYINRMVNVFLDDSPLPAAAPGPVQSALRGLLRLTMRRSGRASRRPGVAADRLSAAALPADLAWASGNRAVAGAFARAAAAIDRAARPVLTPQLRALVDAELDRWDGRPRGVSRSWAHEAVAALPAAQQPAARLALLTGIASYQVDGALIAEVRQGGVDDAGLIALTAWASLAAARRVGTWLAEPRATPEQPLAPPTGH